MYLYLSERNDAQEICFGLIYIMYYPLFYDVHESYSNAANSFDSFFFFNPFDSAFCRWDSKYLFCERFVFCANIIESINKT